MPAKSILGQINESIGLDYLRLDVHIWQVEEINHTHNRKFSLYKLIPITSILSISIFKRGVMINYISFTTIVLVLLKYIA